MIERRDLLPFFHDVFSSMVYPLQRVVSSPAFIVPSLKETFATRDELLQENRRLREEQLQLKAQLSKLAALEKENIRLRGLLQTSFKLGEEVLVAELMEVNLVPFQHVLVVNKGTRNSVYAGQPVMDVNGIVGQVIRANSFSSEVMLITDPNHAIPVQVNRNGLRTIAVGTGQSDKLSLPYLTNNADIKQGDLLVTSGMGGVFPQGYPVAMVTSVSTQSGAFAQVTAQPVAKLDRNRELLLVWSKSGAATQESTPESSLPSTQAIAPNATK